MLLLKEGQIDFADEFLSLDSTSVARYASISSRFPLILPHTHTQMSACAHHVPSSVHLMMGNVAASIAIAEAHNSR